MNVRAVLDTNVVLSALLFKAKPSSPMALLRLHWEQGRITPLICRETAEELLRVLRYPKFQLTEREQQVVLGAYLPYCETHKIRHQTVRHAALPACRDPLDQMYLELAASAKATLLVTGDRDLLALENKVSFRILSPADWLRTVQESG